MWLWNIYLVLKSSVQGVSQKRQALHLFKHLQPWHSSDDGSNSAVGQNVGFFKTLGLCPWYFQAETYHGSCESKVMDGEDVSDGVCSA